MLAIETSNGQDAQDGQHNHVYPKHAPAFASITESDSMRAADPDPSAVNYTTLRANTWELHTVTTLRTHF